MNDVPSPSGSRRLIVLATAVGAAYALFGVAAMLLYSPRVPYADPWRFLVRLLHEPFPANVLASDNGHREVLPNALRLLELECLHANQWLQILAGTSLALLAAGVVLRLLRDLPAPRRALAGAAVAAGVFWLGNGRKLTHGNESVGMFLVLLSLLGGLAALTRDERGTTWPRIWIAAGCALVATFCFGSGLACFPALAVALLLQGAPLARLWPLALVGAATTAALLAGSRRDPFEWAPLERLDLWLRWLGAPSVWAASPLLEPAHAARLPGAVLRGIASPVAQAMHDALGARLTARWPACAFGLAGAWWLLRATWRAHRDPAGRVERIALGLAWFGACVGVLVVGLRLEYFRTYPKEITTLRYVPWSMLLWTGLVVVAAVRARTDARAAWLVFSFAALLLPSTVWTTRIAHTQRAIAELTALGAVVGVLAQDFDLSETEEVDLRRALPLLRDAHAAMFAWPETPWLGRALPPAAATVELADVELRAVANRFPGDGSEISCRADAAGSRLLLLDGERTVIGLVLRLPFETRWRGWLRGTPAAGALRAAAAP